MTRTWVRCLSWWGLSCIAWEHDHQNHTFAYWSLIGESEAAEIRAENLTPKIVRIAWAT